mmetsp:Transcript_120515/g.341533  ORF Transcript_120515/g.341533 Transcript_120515/m.341533 type:complete len:247 (+) Transcript_120515:66-806(+)
MGIPSIFQGVFSLIIVGCGALSSRKMDACTIPRSPADQFRPIKEVLAEHGTTDGYCYFGAMGDWIASCSAAQKQKDWSMYSKRVSNGNMILALGGAPRTLRFHNVTVTSRDHFHPLDDALCAANGFFSIPRHKVHDFEAWNAMAEEHCQWLANTVPNYDKLTMNDFWTEEIIDDQRLAGLMDNPFGLTSTSGLRMGMLKHESVKCLLGTSGCDMAFCAGRACEDEKHRLKYGVECPRIVPNNGPLR